MSAAAGLALFGVAGVAVFSGGSDDESNARVADKERAMSATAEASADSMTATEMGPASTIGNILASGDVAIVIESPEQLLQLSLSGDVTYDSNAGGSDSTAAAAETTAPTTGNTDLAPQGSPEATRRALTCLSDNQVFLADILYMDELAIAARDTVTGVTVAITDDCRVLVAVGP